MSSLNQHWETVYQTKKQDEVSWFQPDGQPSLDLIQGAAADKLAKVVDSGCGHGLLIEQLLKNGFRPENTTGIDISSQAVACAKERSSGVNWIVQDVSTLTPQQIGKVDVWHDRATFHFLVDEAARQRYVNLVNQCVKPSGSLIIATFADDGPEKCSGLPVKRYNVAQLDETWKDWKRVASVKHVHSTPWNSQQSFLYAVYTK
jgi:trans-aconitate methyltransferase